MDRWQALLSVALVGTAHHTPTFEHADDQLGMLLAQLDPAERETALLHAAAVLAPWRRAGQPVLTVDPTLPTPCPPDDLPPCNARAAGHLATMLAGQHAAVLGEWLDLIAANKQQIPAHLLPTLLDAGRKNKVLRPKFDAVIGERGRWLAAHNPAWDYVAGTIDDQTWETGQSADRRAWLERLRMADPARARELLATTWKEEAPDDRAGLLAVLEHGLSIDDEPFLDRALDDRRKEVRGVAIDLLARVPASRFVQGMIGRTASLITFVPAQPMRLLPPKPKQPATITLNLPEAFDPAWARWGIGEKPPSTNVGPKAWWLRQMVALVPPQTWCERWRITPSAAIATAHASEWAEPLLAAWREATIHNRDVQWAEALLQHWVEHVDAKQVAFEHDDKGPLLHVLPPERQHTLVLAAMKQRQQMPKLAMFRLLPYSQRAWSIEWSRAVLDFLKREFIPHLPHYEWYYRDAFAAVALHISPALATEGSTGWPAEHANWSRWEGTVNGFQQILQFRQAMYAALQGA